MSSMNIEQLDKIDQEERYRELSNELDLIGEQLDQGDDSSNCLDIDLSCSASETILENENSITQPNSQTHGASRQPNEDEINDEDKSYSEEHELNKLKHFTNQSREEDDNQIIHRLVQSLHQRNTDYRSLELQFNHVRLQNESLLHQERKLRENVNSLEFELALSEESVALLEEKMKNVVSFEEGFAQDERKGRVDSLEKLRGSYLNASHRQIFDLEQELKQLRRLFENDTHQYSEKILILQSNNQALQEEAKTLTERLAQRTVLYSAQERRFQAHQRVSSSNMEDKLEELTQATAKIQHLESQCAQLDRERVQLLLLKKENEEHIKLLKSDTERKDLRNLELEEELTNALESNRFLQNTVSQLRGSDLEELERGMAQEVEAIRQNAKEIEEGLHKELSEARDLLRAEGDRVSALVNENDEMRERHSELTELLRRIWASSDTARSGQIYHHHSDESLSDRKVLQEFVNQSEALNGQQPSTDVQQVGSFGGVSAIQSEKLEDLKMNPMSSFISESSGESMSGILDKKDSRRVDRSRENNEEELFSVGSIFWKMKVNDGSKRHREQDASNKAMSSIDSSEWVSYSDRCNTVEDGQLESVAMPKQAQRYDVEHTYRDDDEAVEELSKKEVDKFQVGLCTNVDYKYVRVLSVLLEDLILLILHCCQLPNETNTMHSHSASKSSSSLLQKTLCRFVLGVKSPSPRVDETNVCKDTLGEFDSFPLTEDEIQPVRDLVAAIGSFMEAVPESLIREAETRYENTPIESRSRFTSGIDTGTALTNLSDLCNAGVDVGSWNSSSAERVDVGAMDVSYKDVSVGPENSFSIKRVDTEISMDIICTDACVGPENSSSVDMVDACTAMDVFYGDMSVGPDNSSGVERVDAGTVMDIMGSDTSGIHRVDAGTAMDIVCTDVSVGPDISSDVKRVNAGTAMDVFYSDMSVGPENSSGVERVDTGTAMDFICSDVSVGPESSSDMVDRVDAGTAMDIVCTDVSVGPDISSDVKRVNAGTAMDVFYSDMSVGPENSSGVERVDTGTAMDVICSDVSVGPESSSDMVDRVDGTAMDIVCTDVSVGPDIPSSVDMVDVGTAMDVFYSDMSVGPENSSGVERVDTGTAMDVICSDVSVGPDISSDVKRVNAGTAMDVFYSDMSVGPDSSSDKLDRVDAGTAMDIICSDVSVGPESSSIMVDRVDAGTAMDIVCTDVSVGPDISSDVKRINAGTAMDVFYSDMSVGPENSSGVERVDTGTAMDVICSDITVGLDENAHMDQESIDNTCFVERVKAESNLDEVCTNTNDSCSDAEAEKHIDVSSSFTHDLTHSVQCVNHGAFYNDTHVKNIIRGDSFGIQVDGDEQVSVEIFDTHEENTPLSHTIENALFGDRCVPSACSSDKDSSDGNITEEDSQLRATIAELREDLKRVSRKWHDEITSAVNAEKDKAREDRSQAIQLVSNKYQRALEICKQSLKESHSQLVELEASLQQSQHEKRKLSLQLEAKSAQNVMVESKITEFQESMENFMLEKERKIQFSIDTYSNRLKWLDSRCIQLQEQLATKESSQKQSHMISELLSWKTMRYDSLFEESKEECTLLDMVKDLYHTNESIRASMKERDESVAAMKKEVSNYSQRLRIKWKEAKHSLKERYRKKLEQQQESHESEMKELVDRVRSECADIYAEVKRAEQEQAEEHKEGSNQKSKKAMDVGSSFSSSHCAHCGERSVSSHGFEPEMLSPEETQNLVRSILSRSSVTSISVLGGHSFHQAQLGGKQHQHVSFDGTASVSNRPPRPKHQEQGELDESFNKARNSITLETRDMILSALERGVELDLDDPPREKHINNDSALAGALPDHDTSSTHPSSPPHSKTLSPAAYSESPDILDRRSANQRGSIAVRREAFKSTNLRSDKVASKLQRMLERY